VPLGPRIEAGHAPLSVVPMPGAHSLNASETRAATIPRARREIMATIVTPVAGRRHCSGARADYGGVLRNFCTWNERARMQIRDEPRQRSSPRGRVGAHRRNGLPSRRANDQRTRREAEAVGALHLHAIRAQSTHRSCSSAALILGAHTQPEAPRPRRTPPSMT
jgi:hypothetical protein